MNDEILTWALLLVGVAGFAAGAAWQMMRRRDIEAARRRRRRERVGSRPSSPVIPEELRAPKETLPSGPVYGVLRPSMLAVTSVADDVTTAELFIQRACKADVERYREIPCERHELKSVAALFERCPILDWRSHGDLSHNHFTVSFASLLQHALEAGHYPRVNATQMDLHVVALSETGEELGDAMGVPDHGWGQRGVVQTLWEMFDPAEHDHPLAGELNRELEAIAPRLAKVKLVVPAVKGREWQLDWETLFDLTRDARRLGAEEGRALDRVNRVEGLAERMRRVNATVDARLAELASAIKTVPEAETALAQAQPLMYERELSVLFLRAIALLRVMMGDDFCHGMRCSRRIAYNVEHFPDVHQLLDKARALALDALQNASRGMSEADLATAGNVNKEADNLAKAHDECVARLKVDVLRLQQEIDHYLIVQSKPRRFAVRLADNGTPEALLVLD